MQFAFDILVPANTTEQDPYRVATPLDYGQLVKVSVYFPWGCAALCGIRILHYEHQLFPTNLDEWFKGNEILIEFDCRYDILEGWNDFKVEGYNEDDFYAHTPIVTYNVLPFALGGPGLPVWIEG